MKVWIEGDRRKDGDERIDERIYGREYKRGKIGRDRKREWM